MTEAEARNKLGTVKIYTSDFRPMKNVLAGRDERALYKMVVDATTDRVVGLHMIGPDAPEILQAAAIAVKAGLTRSEEHTSELQSLMRISYAVFCLKKNIINIDRTNLRLSVYTSKHKNDVTYDLSI